MITDTINNKILNPTVTDVFFRRKKNISLVFITKTYSKAPKEVRLNWTRFLIINISNRKHFQQIATDYSSDVYYKDSMKSYRACTSKKYSFQVIDTTLLSSNPLRLRCNLLEEL